MCVHVVTKANTAKLKMSTDWMDRNFICFNLHNNVLAMVDLARRMQLFDPELSDTMKRMWQKAANRAVMCPFSPASTILIFTSGCMPLPIGDCGREIRCLLVKPMGAAAKEPAKAFDPATFKHEGHVR